MLKIFVPRSCRWIPPFQRYFVVIISLQIKPKPLITQRSRNISFTLLITAFNAGFFLTKIDEIKTSLTP